MRIQIAAFADYSGARTASEQRKRIAWAVGQMEKLQEGAAGGVRVRQGLTRGALVQEAVQLLREADREGKRVLLGFDHNYGFPAGFYEALFGATPKDWREGLGWYVRAALAEVGACEELVQEAGRLQKWPARAWARDANERMRAALGAGQGPFWGTLFAPYPGKELFGAYELPDGGGSFTLYERRLVEERLRRLKPVYQLGGIGTVGQQTLFGLLHLALLLSSCEEEGIPLHVWPMDGLKPPAGAHIVAEIYPSMHHVKEDGPRTDAGDARACVRWVMEQHRAGTLADWFQLSLTDEEWARVRLEGWVLGVKAR